MLTNPYSKGSLWRRWDLHIHTPGTKKNDQFNGSSIEDKWNNYINNINSYPNEITAIGITDYTCIENYFKFKELMANGTITKQIPLVIPNIELRLLPVTGSSVAINIHCLFNPAFDDKIRDRFLHKLKFDNGTRIYSASRIDLIELGRSYKNNPSLPEESAIKEAIMQYVVSVNDLKALFKEDAELRNNSLIVVANSSTDGVSGLKDHSELIEGIQYASLDATRQAIYKFSEAIFSGSDKDVKYFSGLGVDSILEIKRKCQGLMPCYHGSDAHNNVKIFEPDLKRYCWIKSDPTFNGLRQTLYEPASRVRIQEDEPEQKKGYLIIDEVKFVPVAGENTFSPDAININDKLNAIIGGKSSGKSLLLYYIAKTIDPAQVKKKLEELEVDAGYDFDDNPAFDFEVKWGDGVGFKLRQNAEEKNRQITYIPQMYINFLAENRGKEGLKTLIQSFLEEKENFSKFLKEVQKEQDEIKIGLNTAITQFFQLKGNYNRIVEEIRSKGDKSARLRNIEEKNNELAGLRSIAGFTEKDEEKFEQLEKERKIHQDRLASLQQLKVVYQTEYPAVSVPKSQTV